MARVSDVGGWKGFLKFSRQEEKERSAPSRQSRGRRPTYDHLTAVTQDGIAIEYVHEDLKKDREDACHAAAQVAPDVLYGVHRKWSVCGTGQIFRKLADCDLMTFVNFRIR